MSHLSLNGSDWRLAQALSHTPDAGEISALTTWYPAEVPGDVRLDLQRAGQVPADLYFGDISAETRWVEDADWWYARQLTLALTPGQRAFIHFSGIDYISWVYFNGHLLGHHEGMFSEQRYEVTTLAHEQNRLAVRIAGAAHIPDRGNRRERILDYLESRSGEVVSIINGRRHVVKAQMSFGWDFAPAMRTMGVWDDVALHITGPVALPDLFVRSHVARNDAAFTLDGMLDATQAGPAELVISVRGATWDDQAPIQQTVTLDLHPGPNPVKVRVPIPEPHLWHAWDRGRPDLYDIQVIVNFKGAPSDTWETRTGLREVTLQRNSSSTDKHAPWTFALNGDPLFVRGVNWVPADAFPARVTAADYDDLLGRALAAHVNMVRVWGGGLREKKAFYDTADRLGLLVWQEFPHACAFTAQFPSNPEYHALAESEARAIIRSIRNHPSVVIWCGGNEYSPQRNASLIDALRRAVGAEDDTRPFNPVSPSGGEAHNWLIWHQRAPVATYREDHALFASEFGLQAAPDEESLRRFIPADQLWPPGPVWHHHAAQLDALSFYAHPYAPLPRHASKHMLSNFKTLAAFVEASQRAQADGLQIAIEHFRRRKGYCSGCMIWQFNEPWPAISWAVLDYYRRPKLAYTRLQQCYQPLLISVEFRLDPYADGASVPATVWVINDNAQSYEGCTLELALGAPNSAPIWQTQAPVLVPGDSTARYGQVMLTLPPHAPGAWLLTARIRQGATVLSTNDYQLDSHDARRVPWNKRIMGRVTETLLG